jgi:hypothetical protein
MKGPMKGSGFRIQGSETAETRREFLRRAGTLAAGAGFARLLANTPAARAGDPTTTMPAIGASPSTGPIDPLAKSVVAHVQRKEVIDGARVHEGLMGEMFDDGLRLITGERVAADAWHKLLKPDDIIGIKFNHVGCDELGTTIPFATRLVAALQKAGFPPERIMLIEAPARLTRNLKTRPAVLGFSGGPVSFGSGEEELSAVLQEVTAIINVPFLKTHNIAGMTGCLKNLSHALIRSPGKYHANACAPFVGDIVALPAIRAKLRLHLVNALRVVYRGGPAVETEAVWTHAGLLMSTDPVAADAVGIDLLNEQRARMKLPAIGNEEAHIAHVHAAAQRGLGTDDQDYIRLLEPPPL